MPIKVLIIGAGPAGLTLALGLQRRSDIEIHIYEKGDNHLLASTFNPSKSYSIDITGHGAKAIRAVDAKERFDKELIKFKGIKMTFMNFIDEYNNNDSWIGSRGDICSALQKEFECRNLHKEEHQHNCHHHLYFNREVQVIDSNKGLVNIRCTAGSSSDNDSKDNDNTDQNDQNDKFSMEQFDLIVAADGAGSLSRTSIAHNNDLKFHIDNFDNKNHSMMIHFDQNTQELNPSYLYVFSPPPVFCIAGAINGSNNDNILSSSTSSSSSSTSTSNPKWYCQIAFTDSKSFHNRKEVKDFLIQNIPFYSEMLKYISDDALDEFVKQPCTPMGKAKRCSTFHYGRVVLIGDAGSPFPPIGQGVNAAMEMAILLDKCLG
jgi:2-polyprenyl-6-methoxyphenol hydroxylase-like FAD-dependent oxidoreductase